MPGEEEISKRKIKSKFFFSHFKGLSIYILKINWFAKNSSTIVFILRKMAIELFLK